MSLVEKENKKVAVTEKGHQERLPYQKPAIIYEGTVSIRAGSPVGPKTDPFGAPVDFTE